MLNQQTIEKLHAMRMRGMADAFTQQQEDPQTTQLSFEERFALLVDRQWNWRQNRALERRLRDARLQGPACMEDIDFRATRRLGQAGGPILDPRLGLGATPPEHIPDGPDRARENISGTGVRTEGVPRRLHRLLQFGCAVVPGTRDGPCGWQLCQEASGTGQVDVLIVDDWAMAPLTDAERRAFLEICDERYSTRSTLLTSQLPVVKWHGQIGDPTVADSILDRLVHSAHRIGLQGDSIRKLKGGRGGKNVE